MTRKAHTSKSRGRSGGAANPRPLKKVPPARGKSKVMEHMGPNDGRSALQVLAARHPDLVPEIEQIVRENAGMATFQEVADQVVAALSQLSIFDLGTSSKSDPLGYQQPCEEADDVLTEAIQPFVEIIRRQVAMGLAEAALTHCQGVLLGLYRAERERVTELIEWVPDGMADFVHEPLSALAPVRSKPMRGSENRVGKELKQFARKHLPAWTWLQK